MGNAFNAFSSGALAFQYVTAPLVPWYIQGQVSLHGTLSVAPGNPVLPFKDPAVWLGLGITPGGGLTFGFLPGLWAPGSRTWDFGVFCPSVPPGLLAALPADRRLPNVMGGASNVNRWRSSYTQMQRLARAMKPDADVEPDTWLDPSKLPAAEVETLMGVHRKAAAKGRADRDRYLAIAAKGKGPWAAHAKRPKVEPEPAAGEPEPEPAKRGKR